jgi:hypothetical protein
MKNSPTKQAVKHIFRHFQAFHGIQHIIQKFLTYHSILCQISYEKHIYKELKYEPSNL